MKRFYGITLLALGLTLPVGADWNLNDPVDWFELSAHLRMTAGASSGDLEELASHGHDPAEDFTLQGLELAASLEFNDHVSLFSITNIFLNQEDDLEAELEEFYLQLEDLPGGFGVRLGRVLSEFGIQNGQHLHSWDFVDSNLVTATYLGDEGLISDGAELSWTLSGPVTSTVTVGFGEARTHSHDDHDDEHGSEEANFVNGVLTARWETRWKGGEAHRYGVGLNYAQGENGYGRDSRIYAADATYTYRPTNWGGRYVRVEGELFYREAQWRDVEMGRVEEGEGSHWGAVAAATVGFAEDWEFGLRYDWLQGEESGPGGDEIVFEIEERQRVSAALTRNFELADKLDALARLQVNFDDLHGESDQSVFLQLGFDWGH